MSTKDECDRLIAEGKELVRMIRRDLGAAWHAKERMGIMLRKK